MLPMIALTLAVAAGSAAPSVAPSSAALPAASSVTPKPAAASITLPPAEAGAGAVLESSPRHGEWAEVPGPGDQKIRTWIVYPERKDKAPVVIVLMEIFGLTDWIRAVADRLAGEGFIAVAPDMLSGKGPAGGGSESVASRDEAVKLVRSLGDEEVIARLDAVRAFSVKLPAANGRSGIIGFCWGGARSFSYALAQPALDGAVVYYGSNPSDEAALARLKVPVLGLYGGDDARVNTTIDPAREAIAKAGGAYEVHVFEGAGHGFLRQQEERGGANRKASEAAWPRTIEFLREHLGDRRR
jgi:carboxymethylenebutenolidase